MIVPESGEVGKGVEAAVGYIGRGEPEAVPRIDGDPTGSAVPNDTGTLDVDRSSLDAFSISLRANPGAISGTVDTAGNPSKGGDGAVMGNCRGVRPSGPKPKGKSVGTVASQAAVVVVPVADAQHAVIVEQIVEHCVPIELKGQRTGQPLAVCVEQLDWSVVCCDCVTLGVVGPDGVGFGLEDLG